MALTLSEPLDELVPDPVVVQATQIRRMGRADVEQMRNWLIGRLMRAHPDRNAGSIHVFLVQALESNEYFFIRNGRAVGMAMVQNLPLRAPRVVEMFVFTIGFESDGTSTTGGVSQAAAALYPAFATWARGMGAAQMFLRANTDASKADIEAALDRKLDHGSYWWLGV